MCSFQVNGFNLSLNAFCVYKIIKKKNRKYGFLSTSKHAEKL